MSRRSLVLSPIGLVCAAAIFPSAVGAQDPRLDRRLDPSTRTAVVSVVDSARADGLPTEPLIDKALEGASKRASGERIAAAVRTLAGELANARTLLGPNATADEVVAGARALRAGVSAQTLRRFGQERGRRTMTIALVVLGDLVARGMAAETAAGEVLALARRGAGDDELVAYQQGVERGMQIGAPPVPRTGAATSVDVRSGGAVPTSGGVTQSTGGGTPGTTPRPRKPRP